MEIRPALSYLVVGGVALAAGVAGVAAVGGRTGATATSMAGADAGLEQRLVALESRLDQAASDRLQLGLELAQLRQLAAAALPVGAGDPGAAPTPPDRDGSTVAAALERERSSVRPPDRAADGLARLRARSAEIELAQLELRDRATRNGWIGEARYREARGVLTQELFGLRDEFGDEVWDWMLYDTGHDNRVVIEQVIAGSAADDARVTAGDVLLSYDGRRVFSLDDLREAQLAGDAGQNVEVRWLRGNDEVRSFLPRGPLGVRIETERAAPETSAAGS